MFNWLKKLGAKKSPKTAIRLDEKSADLLAADFEDLEKLKSGLAEEVLEYILLDKGAGVLQTLAKSKGASKAIGVRCAQQYIFDKCERRTKFFKAVVDPDPPTLLRLARVWESISKAEPRYLTAWLPAQDLEWLEVFLLEVTDFQAHSYPARFRSFPAISASLVENMLEADGKPPELLQKAVFCAPYVNSWSSGPIGLFARLPGFAACVKARPAVLREALAQPEAERRVHALKYVEETEVDPADFADRIVELAVSASKQVRERSETWLRKLQKSAVPLVEQRAREGSNEERVQAVALLSRLQGEAARPFLTSRLADEKNKRVLDAIQERVSMPAAGPTQEVSLPPIPVVPGHAPLSAKAREALRVVLEKVEAEALKRSQSQKPPAKLEKQKEVGPWALQTLITAMEDLNVERDAKVPRFPRISWWAEVWKALQEYSAHPDLSLIHVVRLMVCLESISLAGELGRRMDTQAHAMIQKYQRSHPPAVSLRQVGAVFSAVGLSPRILGSYRLEGWSSYAFDFGARPDTLWEYYFEHLDLLVDALLAKPDFWTDHRRAHVLSILLLFPQLPPTVVPMLWDLALGPKKDRLAAQACLEKAPETKSRIISTLGNGTAELRTLAAEWLGRLEEKTAVEPLLTAVRKEKHETPKGAMMLALEKLGVPVEQFVDRRGLTAEAEKGLAKGVPESLKAFPFAVLPKVHWADDASAVDPKILQWFLVQGCKLKDPEPGVLLRRYCGAFKPSEREAFGNYALSAWIDLDTAPIPRAEAEKLARAEAQGMVQLSQQYPKDFPPKSEEEFYAAALPRRLKTPKASAIETKGVLAVAGACGGPGIAPLVGRYLKEWYGVRGAQSKALVQMLAWVEHPTATQLLLAVGNRFRTKGIQDEAARQAQAIADRKGWTLEELADRTIPSAGLDENGTLTLDYGPRQFTARLDEELDLVLTNPDGKTIPSPPDPRAGDDEALAREAKKLYSASKKELKSVLKMQAERMYEAMCIQRSWSSDDWNRYLNRHPIVRHLCGRLIWTAQGKDKKAVTFRPLADGTLTTVDEETIKLGEEDVIRLAHDCNTTVEVGKAWGTHFGDYEVEPLFQQFGRPSFALTEEKKTATELDDFLGHVLDAFALRGRATKLGYSRGSTQDGGWFFDYVKRFPTLGVAATIEFSGNGLPEENRKVALRSLSFQRIMPADGRGGSSERTTLGEVPAVLLTETWNDIRSIAAEGSGFDPDWEKKTTP